MLKYSLFLMMFTLTSCNKHNTETPKKENTYGTIVDRKINVFSKEKEYLTYVSIKSKNVICIKDKKIFDNYRLKDYVKLYYNKETENYTIVKLENMYNY